MGLIRWIDILCLITASIIIGTSFGLKFGIATACVLYIMLPIIKK